MGLGCFECGWNEDTCDIHHILPQAKGGSNDHTNLTVLCPNCHRKAHSGKLTKFVSLEERVGDTWKEHYFIEGTKNPKVRKHLSAAMQKVTDQVILDAALSSSTAGEAAIKSGLTFNAYKGRAIKLGVYVTRKRIDRLDGDE